MMTSSKQEDLKGKISLHYSKTLRNRLKPPKFLTALETSTINMEFHPRLPSFGDSAYSLRVTKIIVFLSQIEFGLWQFLLEEVDELGRFMFIILS